MTRPLNILIVEDNAADAMLISELLQDVGMLMTITILEDGQKVLDALNRDVGLGYDPPPDLIVLDLNLPKVHGFDVLKNIKALPALCLIPVVVMTGSLNRDDETRVRSMGVADYCIKPVCSEDFRSLIAIFKDILTPLAESKRDR